MEKVQIENTKQALGAMLDILPVLITSFKDGVQVVDFIELAAKISSNEELKAKLLEAYNEADLIPSEIADLEVSEILEIASIFIAKIPAVLEALKKQA